MQSTKTAIRKLASKYHEEVIQFRRHLHMHPELSFEEKETAAYISSQLDRWGIDYTSNVGGYGIVAESNCP